MRAPEAFRCRCLATQHADFDFHYFRSKVSCTQRCLDPYALVLCNLLNAVSGAIFGVMMTVVAADLTRCTGGFNLVLGALGVAVSVGASLSTFFTGISAAAFGAPARHSAWLWSDCAGCCCCRSHARNAAKRCAHSARRHSAVII